MKSNYCLTTRFVAVLLFLALCASVVAKESDANFTADNIRVPIYQGNSVLPITILTATGAHPVGTKIELKGVKLDWIGDAITDIRGVVTSPSAVYNRATKQVYGNEWIKYRSQAMDLDGVGFDIDQVKQTIHIRSQVKVVIKGKLETAHQRRASQGDKLHIKADTVKRLVSIAEGLKKPSVDSQKETSKTSVSKKKRVHLSTILWWVFGAGVLVLIVFWVVSDAKSRRGGGKPGDG